MVTIHSTESVCPKRLLRAFTSCAHPNKIRTNLLFVRFYPADDELAIVNDKCVSNVVDSVAVEVATSGTVGNGAAVVQVIGSTAFVAFGITARQKLQGLGNAIALVAVGASEVETDDVHIIFPYLGNGELANDESAESKIVTAVVTYGKDVDGIGVSRRVAEKKTLCISRYGDGAVFAHAFAGSIEHGSLRDILNGQPCWQVAELVVHIVFFTGDKKQTIYNKKYERAAFHFLFS